ncbi:response regulator transcription factor [Sphingobacterium olei]|uniref:Response regulator transcription factor n=1 Tax=Sphingobacterium olei TaxID=2571155 RepID=A0A4U0P645_9SPHI|nr:response regulator transcription factor [Sphingobacterium olei]TJZ62897.1 response regulator transcription factor [Sphingobacterium olei]
MTTIGIVDDHCLIVNGLKIMLQNEPDCLISFTARNGSDLLLELNERRPDVLLLDIELPDTNGIELCEKVLAMYPELLVIALTNYDDMVYVRKMIKKGARGYLLKGTDQKSLLEAISAVRSGKQYIDRHIEQSILEHTINGRKAAVNVKLTNRELEVLELIANEYSNQEIADRLFLSVRTVESHRHSLNQKLNIKTTAGLVKEAFLRGLI